MATVIVVDSTADIDPDVAAAEGLGFVPLFVNFGERRFRDLVELSRERFYQLLGSEKELPTTSQPTSAMFEDVFRPIVERGDEVVSISIASRLSGTINAARAASQQFPGAAIELIDSGQVASGIAILARHANELAKSGARAAEIAADLAARRLSIGAFATVPDLSHAVRTGRVSRAQAMIGGMFKITPVLRIVDGKVEEEARVRTFARGQDAMIEATLRNLGEVANARVAVAHANAPQTAQALATKLREALPGEPKAFTVMETGAVIATHAGPGAVGIFSLPG